KAARLIETAPADGPTNRFLLYFYPSPSTKRAPRVTFDDAGPRPLDVLRSAAHALRVKSLSEDLREIDAHNASVAEQQKRRTRLLRTAPTGRAQAGAVHDLD